MKSQVKKQIIILALSILFVSTSHAQWKGIKGNGKTITITRATSNYEAIKCAGFMNFVLVKGKEGGIKIEGEENLLEHIVTEVKNNILIVKVKNGKSLKPTKGNGIKITIPFEDIEKASLSGSGDLWNEDIISTTNFDVALAGSGDIVLDINTTSIKGSISGSGDLTLKGNTNNLIAKITGSGDFHGFDLEANNTEVSVAGSGDAKVVSNENLKARVAGSGDIVYQGNPEKDTKIAGSGSINQR